MVHFFRRKELITTYDLRDQMELRHILEAANIDYDIKVVDRKNPSPFPQGAMRARTGSFGERPELMYAYVLWVNTEDLERAQEALRQAGR